MREKRQRLATRSSWFHKKALEACHPDKFTEAHGATDADKLRNALLEATRHT